jgi:hypothetical protein
MLPNSDFGDILFAMKADLYYPVITQTQYGQASRTWFYDRTIVCNATSVGGAGTEQIKPEAFLQHENKLIARVKADPRVSSTQTDNAISNILITNIRNANDEVIYRETAGPRSGRGTIYEVATVDPFTGPFGSVEYFKILLRRTENQTITD